MRQTSDAISKLKIIIRLSRTTRKNSMMGKFKIWLYRCKEFQKCSHKYKNVMESWPKTLTQSAAAWPNNSTSATFSHPKTSSISTPSSPSPTATFNKWCPSPVGSRIPYNTWVKTVPLSIWQATQVEATHRLIEAPQTKSTLMSRRSYNQRSILSRRKPCSRIKGTKMLCKSSPSHSI